MAMQIGGMVSGLDTQSLITQLMALERRPIDLLKEKEDAYDVKLSAYGDIKSKLSSLQTAVEDLTETDAFTPVTATSSNEEVLTVSGTNDAALGSYSIVVDQMAQAQAVRSGSFPGADEAVGTGTISIQVGSGDAVEITIDESNQTLAGIAEAINEADAGVSANVVDDGAGNTYLSLMSSETGTGNTINFEITADDTDDNTSNDTGLSKLYNDPAAGTMFETQQALNSEMTVNGIDVVRSGNTIDDLIDGATLTLHKTDATPVNVTVSRDEDAVKEKLNAFVDAYNAVIDEFSEQSASGGEDEEAGALSGDSGVRSISYKLRRIMGDSVSGITGAYNTLAAIGITADRTTGKFEVDETDLNEALDTDLNDIITLFAADSETSTGIATRLNDYLDGALDTTDGIIAAREKGIQSTIKDLQANQERMELRLEKREENLWSQFNAMESLLAGYQATGNYLAQQLISLY